MSKRDYYEVLGVDKNAGADEIKKAYRKAAIKFHPDKNPGDKSSEDKFKEAAEAYDVLSNDDKKVRYDRYGHAGMGGASSSGYGGGGYGGGMGGFSMDDIFERFGDVFGGGGGFGSFFGGGGGGGGRTARRRGTDLRIKVKLTLEEVVNGVTKKLKINKLTTCEKCDGSGAKDPSSVSTCSTCQGSGSVTKVVNTMLGAMQTQSVCPNCQGEGKVTTAPCDACRGAGTVKKEEVVEVRIPAGVAVGMQLSVSGKGNATKNGGVNGDLLVLIEEIPHKELTRIDNDLVYNLSVNVADAILGGTVEIPTVDSRAKIKIEAGTEAGRILRLRGKGVPDVNGYGVGDLLVIVDVYVPKNINKTEKEIIEKLRNAENFQPKKNKINIFERMRGYFS